MVVALVPLARCDTGCAGERDIARVAMILLGAGGTVLLAPAMALLARARGRTLGLLHPLAVLAGMVMAGYAIGATVLGFALRDSLSQGLAWAAVGLGLAAGWGLLGWALALAVSRRRGDRPSSS